MLGSPEDVDLLAALANAFTISWAQGRPVGADHAAPFVEQLAALLSRPVGAQDLRRLRQLAVLVRTAFTAGALVRTDTHAALANELVAAYRLEMRLLRRPDGHWRTGLVPAQPAGLPDRTAPILVGALVLLVTTRTSDRLGVCEAVRCDRVFVDRGRKGHQRYCSSRCLRRTVTAARRARRDRPPPLSSCVRPGERAKPLRSDCTQVAASWTPRVAQSTTDQTLIRLQS